MAQCRLMPGHGVAAAQTKPQTCCHQSKQQHPNSSDDVCAANYVDSETAASADIVVADVDSTWQEPVTVLDEAAMDVEAVYALSERPPGSIAILRL